MTLTHIGIIFMFWGKTKTWFQYIFYYKVLLKRVVASKAVLFFNSCKGFSCKYIKYCTVAMHACMHACKNLQTNILLLKLESIKFYQGRT